MMKLFRNNPNAIKAAAALLIVTTLTGGCKTGPSNDFITPDPEITNPGVDPTATLDPTSIPTPTINPTPTPTLTPEPTPTATPEVILSAKDDICRLNDPVPISSAELKQITVEYVKIGEDYKIFLCTTNPDGTGKTFLIDYFTGKLLFEIAVDSKKDTVTFVPQDELNKMGKAEWLAGDLIDLYMTQTLKMSEEDSKKAIDKIKTGKDLREWYETTVPKNQQAVVPWFEFVGLKANDQGEELREQVKVLEKYREENKILV